METITTCPLCSNRDFSPFLECVDHTVTREVFRIVRCTSCGFTFTNPRPHQIDIEKYYESDEYISHSNTSRGIINFVYQVVRRYTIREKLRLIHILTHKAKPETQNLLDIGCGTGEFLHACQKEGWKIQGIEPSPNAREFAVKRYNLKVGEEGELSTLPDGSFDIITLWHVLEHIHGLDKRMHELNRLLTSQGSIVIAVPNCRSLDAEIYKEHWAAYDVPRHLYHFTPDTMRRLVHNYGMKIVEILPMKFDAFYVSMLSEKYRTGKTNYPRAFLNGLKSNSATKKETTSYSSLIYVITKT
jgi:2-polyprenyl-3-methyl-5-hydroxy-6-metoxy-1,4-benzoquinol methylase